MSAAVVQDLIDVVGGRMQVRNALNQEPVIE